jgi:hypothetical protein
MARTYTLKRRAEQQAETRHRIVEAAVELHGSAEVLGARLSAKQRAMLALSFFTWRTLTRDVELAQNAAVGAMVQAIGSVGKPERSAAVYRSDARYFAMASRSPSLSACMNLGMSPLLVRSSVAKFFIEAARYS